MLYKQKSRRPLNSTQALQCRRLLEWINAAPDSGDYRPFSSDDLAAARSVLVNTEPYEKTRNHVDFAEAIYTEFEKGNFIGKQGPIALQWSYLVQVTSNHGASLKALDMLRNRWNDAEYTSYIFGDHSLVYVVARGLASEGHEKELLELLELASNSSAPYDSGFDHIVTTFFAERDRIGEVKDWFSRPIRGKYRKAATYRIVASFARRNNLQEWAMPIFRELGESRPPKRYWDVLLQATLLLGRNLEDIQAVIPHMVTQDGAITPDATTVNGLLRVATELGDESMADQISSMATSFSHETRGEAHLIMWKLHTQQGNMTAAEESYQQVQHLEPWAVEGNAGDMLGKEYELLLNQYLLRLCGQTPIKFGFLLKVLESVEEHEVRLGPETVAQLCLRLLDNDQHFDVLDLLSTQSFMYSGEEREIVQQAFIHFCLDPSTSTSRAWGGYQILEQLFQDLSVQRRVNLMQGFIDRKRSDMAFTVFSKMRAHDDKAYHPTGETYVQCLLALARYPHLKSLTSIHNMLKMDTMVVPDTKIYTALMLAYTGCDSPVTALEFWQLITDSQEGPSYATLQAVFWLLERKTGGHEKAQQIWSKLQQMDVEVPPQVYNAYVGAMAGSGHDKVVRSLITNMEADTGLLPDVAT